MNYKSPLLFFLLGHNYSIFDFSVSLVPSLLDLCCENVKKRVAKQTDVELLPIPIQLKKYIATF